MPKFHITENTTMTRECTYEVTADRVEDAHTIFTRNRAAFTNVPIHEEFIQHGDTQIVNVEEVSS